MIGLLLLAALAGDPPGVYFGAPGGTVSAPAPATGEAALGIELRFKTLEKLKGSYKVVSRWDATPKAADRGQFFVVNLAARLAKPAG
jgi:hypothetical protein